MSRVHSGRGLTRNEARAIPRTRACSFSDLGPPSAEPADNLWRWLQRFLAGLFYANPPSPSVSRLLPLPKVVGRSTPATRGPQCRIFQPDSCQTVGFSFTLLK